MTTSFRHEWFTRCLAAWWSAWMTFWADLGDEFDPDLKRDRRSQECEHFDSFLVERGNFDGAGTGGQD